MLAGFRSLGKMALPHIQSRQAGFNPKKLIHAWK
jgi:hypothetical protein